MVQVGWNAAACNVHAICNFTLDRLHTVHYDDGDVKQHDLAATEHELLPHPQPAEGPSGKRSRAAAGTVARAGDGRSSKRQQKQQHAASPLPASGEQAAAVAAGVAASQPATQTAVAVPHPAPAAPARGPAAVRKAAAASDAAANAAPPAAGRAAAQLPTDPARSPPLAAAGSAAGSATAVELPSPDSPQVAELLSQASAIPLMPVVALLLDVAEWAGVPAAQVSVLPHCMAGLRRSQWLG